MVRYFPEIYWSYVRLGTILNLVLTAILNTLTKDVLTTILFLFLTEIMILIIFKIILEVIAEREFKAIQKKQQIDTLINTEFYESYLLRKTESISRKIEYSEIDKCIETDTNFYLRSKYQNIIIIIQKNRCDLELINFIRKKFANLENCLGDKTKFNGIKKHHNPKSIRKNMILLFILTIASLWGASGSVELLLSIKPQHGFNVSKYMWIFWCWLPIPISSIVLGYKYRNAGFKCTKNIVGGFIIGFLLLSFGSFSMMTPFSKNYSEINEYKDIIDAKLPKNGELEIQDWYTYIDKDKTEYIIINAYYDQEDVSELESSIENSNNWIPSKEIKSELKIFIPSYIESDVDAYFSIYNKTNNEYNTLPKLSGEYEVYAMKYDKSEKKLEIHKFKYFYK